MGHFFADDGEKIHVHSTGDGTPPIVLLHGWTSSHQEWFPFAAELARRHRVIRWDARGHGGHTPQGSSPPTVSRMARDLHQLLTHFDLSQAVVVGHSMGALTLWQYIRDFGCERLGKVCFIDQSPRLLTDTQWPHGIYGDFDSSRAAEFARSLEEDFPEAVLKLGALGLNQRAREKYLENARGWQKARDYLSALNPAPLIACWRSLTEADYRDVLERIAVPSLLIYGGESNFYHTHTAQWVGARIPGAILRIYEGTDHSPHQWQRERFVQDLLAFASS